jgi:hypothetical protein
MEDDLDQDAYGDDFSESGRDEFMNHSNNQEDDEQHTQKVIEFRLSRSNLRVKLID